MLRLEAGHGAHAIGKQHQPPRAPPGVQAGQVLGKADLSEIWQRVKQIDPQVDVPNGIAYDSVTKKTFITGKRWPKLFEVQFGN
ncbi:MAG: hypothetical protein B7Z54_08020 [Sphingobacteriales bacterium 12-47-4]|nr:MAG: hypothetical protein B7Z54_08020 [Sphingobacteriales bacterium 12-47-4]